VPKVCDVIKGLLPNGSLTGISGWAACPVWPADAFAVAATLVGRSACYSKFRVGENAPRDYVKEVRADGEDWIGIWEQALSTGYPTRVPDRVQAYWDVLSTCKDQVGIEIRPDAPSPRWWDAAMRLLAASDEASVGVGFHHDPEPGDSVDPTSTFAKMVRIVRAVLSERESRERLLRDSSICRRVLPQDACVQPKARTAQVGCTLRSLSHHLALVPPSGEVRSEWFLSPVLRNGQMNLLLVPFPYTVPSKAFEARPADQTKMGNYFGVSPDAWLGEKTGRIDRVVKFLCRLVDSANSQGATVHGIVLPELALDIETADKTVDLLGKKYKGQLELLICGVAAPGNNAVLTAAYDEEGTPVWRWTQRKHHRWRLDASQIRRYRLAHVLDQSKTWWEDTKLAERIVRLLVFRHGATLSALVCEDLARADPAQSLLRALGPNLVVALLMDGPQLQVRWPGQYATVLAEDPGSSVLTLTSLGMVRRAHDAPPKERWNVALWKEYGHDATEICLDHDAQAVLATLFLKDVEEVTLDRRRDGGTAVHVSLGQTEQIRLQDLPEWVR
jgi:hypothetical protein